MINCHRCLFAFTSKSFDFKIWIASWIFYFINIKREYTFSCTVLLFYLSVSILTLFLINTNEARLKRHILHLVLVFGVRNYFNLGDCLNTPNSFTVWNRYTDSESISEVFRTKLELLGDPSTVKITLCKRELCPPRYIFSAVTFLSYSLNVSYLKTPNYMFSWNSTFTNVRYNNSKPIGIY